jgi:hypothetical protein
MIDIEAVFAMSAKLKPYYSWDKTPGRKVPVLYNWDRNIFAA